MVSVVEIVMELSLGVNRFVLAQIDTEGFPVWVVYLLAWGCLVGLIVGIIIGLTLWAQGRNIRKRAGEAGIDAPLPESGRDLRPFGIHEGWWVLIGTIFVGVIWLLSPLIQATVPELAIAIGAFSILAGVVWFFIFYGVVYLIHEYRKRERLLQEAIQQRGVTAARPKKPKQCSACGAMLGEDDQFCSQCGAASH
jgi:hypothetical protein